MITDYSVPFLLPVSAKLTPDGMEFTANGETLRFSGSVFSPEITVAQDSGERTPANKEDFSVSLELSDGVTLHPSVSLKKDARVDSYRYFCGAFSGYGEIAVAKTSYCGICAFMRMGKVSFFLSLDFPYSEILHDGDSVSIGCDPLDGVSAGEGYTPHTLTVGAARLTGEYSGAYDRGEIEAVSEYISSRIPSGFNKPVYSAACITNRMADVREGRVFYSMYDNPTLTLDPETLKKEVRLCAELGIEYYQVFEGFYDWSEDGTSAKNLDEIVELARSLGVRVGDYMTPGLLYCYHYNYYDRAIKDETLLSLDENGNRTQLCYGTKRVTDFLKNTIVKSHRDHKEEMICLDYNAALPCFDPAHEHNPGSMYAQTRGIIDVISAFNDISPNFMTWSNSGNWLEFCPKLVWYNQNVYLTDPHPRRYSSSLNNLKYYGDCRREQMVTVHEKYFVSYSVFTNCEYYAFRHSRLSDDAVFEYSFLQGLAVTPNLCFGELRNFLDRTASSRLDYVKGFIKKWFTFIRENYAVWKYTYRLFDEPGVGAREGYAHVKDDRGYICFVNQNNTTSHMGFNLDCSVGLKKAESKRFLLSEIYPGEYPLAEQPLPGPVYGDRIELDIEPFSVRIIKLEPLNSDAAANGEPRFYGCNAETEKTGDKYTLKVCERSGKRISCAVYLPEDECVAEISAAAVKTVPKYTFEPRLEKLEASGRAARFELVMPRERFVRELPLWRPEGESESFLLDASCSDFAGGYIHNMYEENKNVVLSVQTKSLDENRDEAACVPPEFRPPYTETACRAVKRRYAAYEAQADIPFIEWPALSMMYGLDEIMELTFSDCKAVKAVRAFIDGRGVPVHEYRYPPAPEMKAFYIELVGEMSSGTRPVVRVEIDWNEEKGTETENKKTGKKINGVQVVG